MNLMSQYIHSFYAIVESVDICLEEKQTHPSLFPKGNFRFTEGEPNTFERGDLEKPRTRYFCGNCGTHICVKSPPRPGMLVLKIGTLDDHSWFKPQSAIYCVDKQPYHLIPGEVPSFERVPPSKP